jgi:hypothetical protein
MAEHEKFPKQPPLQPDRDREIGKRHPPDTDHGTYHPPLEKIDTPERWPGKPDSKDKK